MGNFKFSVVESGQRNVNVEPELIALSTIGGFRLTGPVTKALDIRPTDYVMFLHDEESNTWAIAKGFACKDSRGEYQMCSARIDKKAAVMREFDEVLASAMASGKQELIDALSVEGITKDEQVEILASVIEVPETIKYKGAKTASPSGFTGAGVNVNFTDSNVWNQLKSDMEEKDALNRKFSIDLNAPETVTVFDGHDEIEVKAFVLGEYSDSEPARRGESSED